MRVLIVRIGAMGDVLHAMPAVAALRAAHPDWFIGWAIEPRWSDLLQIVGDPDDLSLGIRIGSKAMVDRWYSIPTRAWKRRPLSTNTLSEIRALRKVLRDEKFDLCVDMQGAIKSAAVGLLAEAKVFAGQEKPREHAARMFYDKKLPVTAAHVVEQGCELLGEAVGETLRPARVPLPMNEEAENWADGVVGRDRFCLISPGAGWGAKVWPADRLGRVAAEVGRAGVRTVVNASVKWALAGGGRSGGNERGVRPGAAVLGGAIDCADAARSSGDRGRFGAAAPGGGAGAASGGNLRANRSGAQWAVRDALARVS